MDLPLSERPPLVRKEADGGGHWDVYAYSPDGATLLSVVTDMGEDFFPVWESSTGNPLKTFEAPHDGISSITYNSQGDVFATGHENGSIRLWNTATFEDFATLGDAGRYSPVTWLRFHPEGEQLAAGTRFAPSLHVWDTEKMSRLLDTDGPLSASNAMLYYEGGRFSPDGKLLAVVSGRSVHLLDASTFKQIRTLDGHTAGVMALAFHPDGTILATGARDGTIRLWDVAQGRAAVVIEENQPVTSLAFNPNGTHLVSGDYSGAIRARDVSFYDWSFAKLLEHAGTRTNARVCRETFKVAHLLPFPPSESIWVEDVLSPREAREICHVGPK